MTPLMRRAALALVVLLLAILPASAQPGTFLPFGPPLVWYRDFQFTKNLIAPTIGPSAAQQHTIPAVPSDTLAVLGAVQTWTAVNTFNAGITTGSESTNYVSLGALPAVNGALRLSNNTSIYWRNAANTADIQGLGVDGANQLTLGATLVGPTISTPTIITGGSWAGSPTLTNAVITYGAGNMGITEAFGSGSGTYTTTTTGSFVDVDNTNLKVTNSAPATWKTSCIGIASVWNNTINTRIWLAIAAGGTVLRQNVMEQMVTAGDAMPIMVSAVNAGTGSSVDYTLQWHTEGTSTANMVNGAQPVGTARPTLTCTLMPSS